MKAVAESVLYDQTAIQTFHGMDTQFRFNWHYHQLAFEISLILTGQGLRYTGDAIDNVSPPEMIFIPPKLPHSWRSEGTPGLYEFYVFQFRGDFAGAPVNECPDLAELSELMSETRAQKVQLTKELIAQAINVHETQGLSRYINFLQLLAQIARTPRTHANECTPALLDTSLEKKFQVSIDYIYENWGEPISVPQLAKRCSMSESTFRRFFKRSTGKSFIEYLNVLKVAKACEYLTENQNSITEVSLKAGFRNLPFFNRKFREIKGMTPSEFRKQHNA